ncbi:MAG: tyrosine-type recombinase/integrase [Faecalibacterium prausnitzii]
MLPSPLDRHTPHRHRKLPERDAGAVRLFTPHNCRHTDVSQMQALGVDIQTIQSIVGHADTEMTEHYLHVQESIRQSAIQLFSEAFSA